LGRCFHSDTAGADGEKPFRLVRRGLSVALGSDVELRCVDLDETQSLPVRKRDRVAIGDLAICRRAGRPPNEGGKRHRRDDQRESRDMQSQHWVKRSRRRSRPSSSTSSGA
jgi:hypothetical protein